MTSLVLNNWAHVFGVDVTFLLGQSYNYPECTISYISVLIGKKPQKKRPSSMSLCYKLGTSKNQTILNAKNS